MAYWVTQRRNELGIRMALGAEPGQILKLVVGHALLLAAIGLGIGLILAVACARVISGLLFGIPATDLLSFGVSCVLVISMAALASFVPALRATRVDPMAALRRE